MKLFLLLIAGLLFAPLQSLLTAATPPAGSTAEHFPDFSWERVPRYIHIRKDTAFTEEEIRYLATFPLITFEKSTGNKDAGSTEAGTLKAARAVRAINRATKILYYRNVIVHYGGYAANAALADIPGAFLKGKTGSDKLVRNTVQAYDLTNKAVRDWWISSAKQLCDDPAIDGLFVDGAVKVLEPAYLRSEIGAEKKAAGFTAYVTLMQEARQMLGPKKLMIANVLRARFPDSGLGQLRLFDGSYIEGFEGAVGLARKDYVAKGIEAIQTAARQGSIIAFTCGLGENLQDADEAPRAEGAARPAAGAGTRFTYLLATFLICAERFSYFDLTDGYDAKKSKLWLTRAPEYDRPLGAPAGPAVRAGYTYSREFAHASVRVDIEKQTGSIQWR